MGVSPNPIWFLAAVEILEKRDPRRRRAESLVETSDRSELLEIQVDSESATELNGTRIKCEGIEWHQVLSQPSKRSKMVLVRPRRGNLLSIPDFARSAFSGAEITFNTGWSRVGVNHQGLCVGNEIHSSTKSVIRTMSMLHESLELSDFNREFSFNMNIRILTATALFLCSNFCAGLERERICSVRFCPIVDRNPGE
jgi:hypothetical protein